jgi:phosphoribosylformylglycinamidine cyclo-ligase
VICSNYNCRFYSYSSYETIKVIDNANIKAGDVIVGLASFGQATYEKSYNGGMGSNGLTSARHDVLGINIQSLMLLFPDDLIYPDKLN